MDIVFMVNKGWSFSELMNMKLPTLLRFITAQVEKHNKENKE